MILSSIMKQKYYFILGIVAALGLIIISGCNLVKPQSKISVPVVVDFSMEGIPALNEVVTLKITAKGSFSEDMVNKMIEDGLPVKVFFGLPPDYSSGGRTDVGLPEGFELVDGSLSFEGDVPQDQTVTITAKVKAVKTGYYEIYGYGLFPGAGKSERLFVKVTDSIETSKFSKESILPSKPFTDMVQEPRTPNNN